MSGGLDQLEVLRVARARARTGLIGLTQPERWLAALRPRAVRRGRRPAALVVGHCNRRRGGCQRVVRDSSIPGAGSREQSAGHALRVSGLAPSLLYFGGRGLPHSLSLLPSGGVHASPVDAHSDGRLSRHRWIPPRRQRTGGPSSRGSSHRAKLRTRSLGS